MNTFKRTRLQWRNSLVWQFLLGTKKKPRAASSGQQNGSLKHWRCRIDGQIHVAQAATKSEARAKIKKVIGKIPVGTEFEERS